MRRPPNPLPPLLLLVACAVPVASVRAQWTSIRIAAPGSTQSACNAGAGGQQGGYTVIANQNHASLWTGTSASWIDLHPAGALNSVVAAITPYVQVGSTVNHAALWIGTAASHIDLNPANASASAVRGTDGAFHVGWQQIGIYQRACVWPGSSTMAVDLQPAVATTSAAHAISGAQIVGDVGIGNPAVGHAALWSNSSFIDLHPAGANLSSARGVEGGQQVGYARINLTTHACLWTGSASSWVDLHDPTHQGSAAAAAFGGYQVGWITPVTNKHAAIWSGSAGSLVDLQAFMPTFQWTEATGVWSDGATLYVTGRGYDSQYVGVLWTMPLGANSLATNAQLGAGCGTLSLAATTRPVLGTQWHLTATGIPAGTQFGISVLGTTDPGILDLAFVGLPGCQLRANVDVVLGPWLPTGATFALPLAIPAAPASLVGFLLFAQAATFAVPAPNAFGAITSNGIAGVVGDH
ncbi:MAG: hypothetical protein ABIP94_01920 [Planctomycetota bacterium]